MPFPVAKFHFKVEVFGTEISFQEVTGLDQEAESLEYRSGSDPEFVTEKRAGMLKTANLSLKKGLFKSDTKVLDIWKPLLEKTKYYSTSAEPENITINLLDQEGNTVATWKVQKAVPVKFTNADLKSEENAISIEQIDFVHSGISLELS
jgi:phage tail-like protein